MRILLLFLCCMMVAPAWAAPGGDAGEPVGSSVEVDRAVQALCSKQVVLLGEDANHASAATIALKVRLLERLVRQCGFRGVIFESQFYDMLDFERAMAAGSATRKQLSHAIGALWSRYAEFAPLEAWLFDQAKAGRVRVGGIDPQVGGITAHYSQQQLPTVLSSVLVDDRRADCERIIGRHDRWEYDDEHPFDAAATGQLRSCLRDIREALAAMGRRAPTDLRAMANSYANYLGFADGSRRGLRDRAMYQNLMWIRARWPKGTRLVIWTATVHAAKTLAGTGSDARPLGDYVHEAFGDRAAAIGFSAMGGSFGDVGGRGAIHVLPAAAPGTLEARAFAAGDGALRFLDHTQLKSLGKVSARAFSYRKPQTLDWSRLLDGMFVLRKETAAVATAACE